MGRSTPPTLDIRVLAMMLAGVLATHAALARPSAAAEDPPTCQEVDAPGRVGRPGACSLSDRLRTEDTLEKPISQWEHLTGDWGGGRIWLHERGLIPRITYTVEVMSKLSGGATDAAVARTLGNLDLTLTAHSEPLLGWEGGTFFIHFENLVGNTNGVNPQVGFPFNVVTTLNSDESFTRLMAYYYEQELAAGKLRIKVGKQDAVVDFLTTDTLGEYLNLGVNPPGNVPMPTWPVPELGLAVFGKPVDWIELGAGVYGGEPSGSSFDDAGLFSGNVFAIGQIETTSEIAGRLVVLQIGGWLSTIDWPALDGPEVFGKNYGAYALYDQELLGGALAGRSAHAWIQFTWSPPDRNENSWWLGGGLLWTGVIGSSDEVGIGVYYARASDAADTASDAETTIELFYKFDLTPWLSFQPDLQYFIDPAANGRDAFVAGVRTAITF